MPVILFPLASMMGQYLPVPQAASRMDPVAGQAFTSCETKRWWTGSIVLPQFSSYIGAQMRLYRSSKLWRCCMSHSARFHIFFLRTIRMHHIWFLHNYEIKKYSECLLYLHELYSTGRFAKSCTYLECSSLYFKKDMNFVHLILFHRGNQGMNSLVVSIYS